HYFCQRNLYVTLALEAFKLRSRLYQENVVVGDQVVESQSFQLARSIDTVEINVKEADPGAMVFVDQGEGWTGDVFRRGGLKGFGNAFDQSGLAGSQIAAPPPQ